MKLTLQTILAIRTMLFCAADPLGVRRVSDIAEACDVPKPFQHKLIAPLVRQGFLDTLRGRNGGIRLARPPSEISILDIVRATEQFALADCFCSSGTCPRTKSCDLSVALHDALDAFFDVLSRYSLADLIAGNGSLPGVPASLVGDVTGTAAPGRPTA